MLVLGIETSCDETAVAVVRNGGHILANLVSSQVELHKPWGGVVPEIASRQHLRCLDPLLREALACARISLEQIEAVAATRGPGLATSLLVGLSTGKAIAAARSIPFLGVNHLEGHLFSPFLDGNDPRSSPPVAAPAALSLPFVSLIVSGGHTLLVYVRQIGEYELLGQTVDDAAGEAFDKVAKLLGLGYPGGPVIDRLAREGNPQAVPFPRGMARSGDFQFSFSGLKTAVRIYLQNHPDTTRQPGLLPDLCASFQEAVVDVLVEKTVRAARHKGVGLVAVSGGVACNSRLRQKLRAACDQYGLRLLVAAPALCTDNAAMIAAVAHALLSRGVRSGLDLDVDPNLRLGDG